MKYFYYLYIIESCQEVTNITQIYTQMKKRTRIKRVLASTRKLNNPLTSRVVLVGATHGINQFANTPINKYLNTK